MGEVLNTPCEGRNLYLVTPNARGPAASSPDIQLYRFNITGRNANKSAWGCQGYFK